jgi:hypothetical protein
MKCNFSMCNGRQKLFKPTTTGWFDLLLPGMSNWLQAMVLVFDQLSFPNVNLTPSNWFGWHAQIEKPLARLNYTFVLFAAIGSTWPTGPLSNAPVKIKCGTLGACILFPRKDIQLRVWGLSVGLVFSLNSS